MELLQESGEAMRVRALDWYTSRAPLIGRLLEVVSHSDIETTHKLSEMNKFCKEIDR